MNPNGLDWAIVLLSIVLCAIPPILLAKRAGSSTAEFFTSGQSAPWWLIGVSMVATTSPAALVSWMEARWDTPGRVLSASRMAVKRGARNCRLSCVSNTTLARPPSR